MAIFVFVCGVPEVLSQTTRATLIGTVTDPNGAVVPGAIVHGDQRRDEHHEDDEDEQRRPVHVHRADAR